MDTKAQMPFRVVTYNVENLFDTLHDDTKNDYEFLPEGNKQWTRYRYWRKLISLTKVISAISETRIPDLIGCCEVENDSVLRDWTLRTPMKALGYKFVTSSSPDIRGIDVALLYQPGSFRYIDSKSIPIPSESSGYKPTRNILYVRGKIISGDTIHVIVCHFPSRGGRTKESSGHRELSAVTLTNLTDSIFTVKPDALIIALGDFNATSNNKIFTEYICNGDNGLFLLPLLKEEKWNPDIVLGSYRYRGHWEQIDHILLSKSFFVKDSPVIIKTNKCKVFALPFMLEKDNTYGGFKPYRTYQGPLYRGGCSDHLPVFADMIIVR